MYNRRFKKRLLKGMVMASAAMLSTASHAQWTAVGSSTGISTGGASYVSLVRDSVGNFYVAYQDTSATGGSVMKYDGSSWGYMGTGAGVSGTNTMYNGVAVNNAGDIYYSYQDIGGGNKLSLKQLTSTTVARNWPAISNGQVYSNSIKIGPSDYPYQVSRDLSLPGSNLVAKRYDGTSWQQLGTTSFGPAMLPYYASMAIGKNDSVYVSWVSALSTVQVYKIHATASSTTSWQAVGSAGFPTSTSNSIFQTYSALAIDTSNRVYVVYVSTSVEGNKLKVRMYENGAWSTVGTDNFSSGTAAYVSIAVTPSGTPYIAYTDGANSSKTTVMKYDGTDWVVVGTAGISAGAAKYNSLILDENDNPVVAFTDAGNNSKVVVMRYAPPCGNADPATTVGSTGCVTFKYNGSDVTYATVRGADDNIWLQQNLGSDNVAGAITDANSYGDVFQWGRWADGHQVRTAATAAAPTVNDPSGLGTGSLSFITGSPSWWSGGALTDTWTADTSTTVSSTNGCDPCKAMGNGWHMPSQAEWASVITAEGVTTQAQAYNSNLKLPMAGYRNTSGNLDFVNARGYYWSATTSSTGAKYLYCGTTIINPNAGGLRGQGASIRCMKASVITVDSVKIGTLNGAPDTISTNGGSLQLTANVFPNWVNQNVTWTVTPITGSAAVSSTGLVLAMTNGEVLARSTSVLDITKSDTMRIVITNQIVPITKLLVSVSNNRPAIIDTFEGTLQMVAKITPSTANQSVVWSLMQGTGTAAINAAGLVTAQTDGTVWAKAVSVQDTSMRDSMQIVISNQTPPATGIHNISGDEMKLYPNPFDNGFYIQLAQHEKGELFIIDQLGRKLMNRKLMKNESMQPVYIDVSNLPAGSYHVVLQLGSKVYTSNITRNKPPMGYNKKGLDFQAPFYCQLDN
ncbi:MAG: T9SS type A sorting domain-containing protein [Sphingobacteriales bacterium]|nr:MAG: T9SS type A sorting domain-containing protein [Sphingobacteriales bacterium]